MKPNVKIGLIGGVLLLAILLTLRLGKPEGILSNILQYSTILLPLAAVYLAVKKQREVLGGRIEFVQALRAGFLTALIIAFFFSISFFVITQNADIYFEINAMKKAGIPVSQIAANLELLQKPGYLLAQSLISGLLPLLFGCMGAIGAAAIMTKRS